MNEQVPYQMNEQLSALVDDELPAAERELLIARITRDPGLRERWQSYHLIGDVMRQQLSMDVDPAFVNNVMDGLPDSKTKAAARWNHILKPIAGLAVAASVAVVVVLAVQNVRVQEDEPIRVAQTPVPVVSVQQRASWKTEPEVGKQLNQYLVNHNEYAASRSMKGMLPYAHIVSYDNEK